MEEAVLLLSNAYEQSLRELKSAASGSPAGSMPQLPEGDLECILSEFAEAIAQKALIDGHIAVLQGECRTWVNITGGPDVRSAHYIHPSNESIHPSNKSIHLINPSNESIHPSNKSIQRIHPSNESIHLMNPSI